MSGQKTMPAPRRPAEAPIEQAPDKSKRGDKLKGELDELLDEIDEVLEENAEDFVASYIQKGGQ